MDVLVEARAKLEEMKGLRVVAPLYFKNTGKSDRLGFLEARLYEKLNTAAVPATA